MFRRKLRLANQKLKEQDGLLKNVEDKKDSKTDATFERKSVFDEYWDRRSLLFIPLYYQVYFLKKSLH